MGRLRITKNGIILEGPAEFVKTLKAKYIMSRGVSVFISNYQYGLYRMSATCSVYEAQLF